MPTLNVKTFYSTDTGAPQLSGTAGTLVTLLTAVLQNGYNSKTASSLVISSNVATVNCTSHGYRVGQCILISGATTPSAINGEWYITSITTNTFTFATTSIADQTATGTVGIVAAPLGWTTNLVGGWSMTSGTSAGFSIDDSNALYARIVGYDRENNAFPTTAQLNGGIYLHRSSTSGATARPWVIVGTSKHLFIYINESGSATGTDANAFYLGDLKVDSILDTYGTIIIGSNTTAGTSANTMATQVMAITTSSAGHFISRSYTQVAGSVLAGKWGQGSLMNNVTTIGSSGIAFPWFGISGNVLLSRIHAHESAAAVVRGTIPGIWAPCHNRGPTHLDTYDGQGLLLGKKFQFLNMYSLGQIAVEISNTWDM